MAYARCGSHVLLVHGEQTPSDAEWAAYLADLARWIGDQAGLLIFTDGGGPTSAQRRALREVVQAADGADTPTAVVSSNRLVRGIVIAISLFAPRIRVFTPEALGAALAHVGVTPDERDEVMAKISALRRGLE